MQCACNTLVLVSITDNYVIIFSFSPLVVHIYNAELQVANYCYISLM